MTGRVFLTNIALVALAATTVAIPSPLVAMLALATGAALVALVLARFSRPRGSRGAPHRAR